MKVISILLLCCAALAQIQSEPARKQSVTANESTSKTPLPASVFYVRTGAVFDGVSETIRPNVAIIIRGDRIQAVGDLASTPVPPGSQVIDLSAYTVTPGLIDCHTHLGARADHYEDIFEFKNSPLRQAIAAVENARRTLLAGFTTVRDVGSTPFLAVDLRETIKDGYINGPRVIASGPGISITGGHGDLNNYAPEVQMQRFPAERDFALADGVDQVRHIVRAQLKYGVDVVKIMATGGVLSKGDQPGAPQYTLEELKAAAEEAHAGGRKIAAHAHGAEGIKRAISAGIDSIEHASLVDDDGIRLAREHGTYFVMDIYNDDYLVGRAIDFGLQPEHVEKEKAVGRLQRENFRKAVQAGVKMAFGTDAGVYPHGENAHQFAYMVQFGMTPAQAIRAATSSAADLIGRKDLGTIQPGMLADMIAVKGDPLKNIRLLENVQWVMKGGTIIKSQPATSSK
jgi:imidazolonepropionase-like amidohydrolase